MMDKHLNKIFKNKISLKLKKKKFWKIKIIIKFIEKILFLQTIKNIN